MRYNSSWREKCPPLRILTALLLLVLTTKASLPASLFTGPLFKDRSFKIKMEESLDFTFTIFGWIQVRSIDSNSELSLLTVLKSNLDDIDKPDRQGAADSSDVVSTLLLQKNHLILSVKHKFVKGESSIATVELRNETWYFLAYSFDRQKKTATVFLSNPLEDFDSSEVNMSVAIPDSKLTGFMEANAEFGKDDSDHRKGEIKFRDFSLVSWPVKNLKLLYLFIPQTGSRYIDYILSVKSLTEINNLQAITHADIKEHKIGFIGQNIRTTENGWIAFSKDSYVEFPNILMQSSLQPNHSVTVYLKFKLTADISENFSLFSSAEKFNSSALNFEVRLLWCNSSDRRVVLYFPKEQREIKTDITLKTDVIQEMFVTFSFLRDQLSAIVIKANENDLVIPIKFRCKFKQAVFWVLPPNKRLYEGEVTLYRVFASQNVDSILASTILENTSKDSSCKCIMPVDSSLKSSVQCLMCKKDMVLNPLSHICAQTCEAGRRISHGICIECATADCSNVTPVPDFQVSRIRPNEFKIKINPQNVKSMNLQTISDDFEFYTGNDLQRKLNANKKLLEAEEIVFELAGEPQKFEHQEVVVKLHHRLLGNSQETEAAETSWQFSPVAGIENLTLPPTLIMDASLKPVDEIKPTSGNLVIKIIALIVIAIFGVSLLFGFAGCLLPLKLPTNSFFHQKVIQASLAYQYICFWSLYAGSMATSFGEFLSYLFKYSIGVQQLFVTPDNQLPLSNNKNLLLHSNNVTASFVSNMTIVLMVQAAVVVIFLTLSLFEKGNSLMSSLKLDDSSSQLTFSRWVFITKWRAIFTIFIMMAMEIGFFATIQFFNLSFSSVITIVSFAIATLLCIILLTQLIIVTVHATRTREQINDASGLAFASSSLQFGFRRLFLPIQTCFYILFAVILALPFSQAWIPIVINYSATTILGFIGAIRFPEKSYWRNEQTVAHILLWLAKTFFVVMQFEAMYGFMNSSVSRILSYGAILFTSLSVLWNSAVVAESLIREVKAEKRRIHLQNIFVIRMVGADESFQRANKSAVLSVDKFKNSNDGDRSFVRFSAKNIYSYSEKKSDFSKLKTNHSAEVLVKDDDAIKTKLASLNFPSKLAQLKFCQFPSSEKIGSCRSLSEKKLDDKNESSPIYLIKVKDEEDSQAIYNYQNRPVRSNKDTYNENSKSKGSTKDTSRLRPMSHEISFSASENLFDSGVRNQPSPAELKFNQILTQSKLMKLKDSVSFVKKRPGESELDASNTEMTILPTNYYSSRVIGHKTDNELAPISRVTNFSNIHYVCDEFANEDDTKTIDDLNDGFALGASRNDKYSPLNLSQNTDSSRFFSEKTIGRKL